MPCVVWCGFGGFLIQRDRTDPQISDSENNTRPMSEIDETAREDGYCGYIGDGREKPCKLVAGWGYNTDSGLCRNHSNRGGKEGNQNAVGNDGGPPEENQNAQRHALFSDHDGYYNDLDDAGQEWVFDFTHTLLDRYRNVHGKEPDMFDKEALKNIAIDFHRVAHANSWFREEGLVNEDIEKDPDSFKKTTKINVWAKEIRQYNESVYRRMQKHGLLDDPESQKADGMNNLAKAWREGLKPRQ